MKVLATAASRFGQIAIEEDEDRRWLMIGNELEGGAFLQPSSHDVSSDIPLGPGPVSDLPYSLAWLLAGTQHPSGEALMIGLGSGSGAIALLYNFPQLKVTVIEIEPNIIQLASQFFPLIPYYIASGRLQIIAADAASFITQWEKKFTFAMVDAFSGQGSLILTQQDFYQALIRLSKNLWINYLGVLDESAMQHLEQDLIALNLPINFKLRPRLGSNRIPYNKTQIHNWVLGTQFPDLSKAISFKPYAALANDDVVIKELQNSFRLMLSTI
jgi:hypothetical protein